MMAHLILCGSDESGLSVSSLHCSMLSATFCLYLSKSVLNLQTRNKLLQGSKQSDHAGCTQCVKLNLTGCFNSTDKMLASVCTYLLAMYCTYSLAASPLQGSCTSTLLKMLLAYLSRWWIWLTSLLHRRNSFLVSSCPVPRSTWGWYTPAWKSNSYRKSLHMEVGMVKANLQHHFLIYN